MSSRSTGSTERGVTPEWFYGKMARLGPGRPAGQPVPGQADEPRSIGWRESVFLSRRHIDWSRTRAYAQGNFGQIFLNVKGRQPQGCVAPADVRPLLEDLKAGLLAIPHPETGAPLVERVYERDELYHGPHAAPRARPDGRPGRLAVPDDRPARLHHQPGDLARLRADRRPPDGGDPRRRRAPPSAPARRPTGPTLLDIAPTVLHLLGVPVPADMDGRVLTEILDPALATAGAPARAEPAPTDAARRSPAAYTEEEDAEIQQRLADLGYL